MKLYFGVEKSNGLNNFENLCCSELRLLGFVRFWWLSLAFTPQMLQIVSVCGQLVMYLTITSCKMHRVKAPSREGLQVSWLEVWKVERKHEPKPSKEYQPTSTLTQFESRGGVRISNLSNDHKLVTRPLFHCLALSILHREHIWNNRRITSTPRNYNASHAVYY